MMIISKSNLVEKVRIVSNRLGQLLAKWDQYGYDNPNRDVRTIREVQTHNHETKEMVVCKIARIDDRTWYQVFQLSERGLAKEQ